MNVFIERENQNKTIKFSGSVKDLLKKLDINLGSVLVVRNRNLITEEDGLEDSDSIKILSVISGG